MSESTGPFTLDRCETLWQSKGSLPSSSDLDTGEKSQDINFEEKLEEANSLIEKVRETLKDIGKGIHKLPEQKKSQRQEVGTRDVETICLCSPVSTEGVPEIKEETSEPAESDRKAPSQEEAPVEVPKESEKRCECAAPKGDDELTSSYLESLKRIQEKLQTISEISDNELELKKKAEETIMVDKSCSPIALAVSAHSSPENGRIRSSERVFLLTQETQTSNNMILRGDLYPCERCCFSRENSKLEVKTRGEETQKDDSVKHEDERNKPEEDSVWSLKQQYEELTEQLDVVAIKEENTECEIVFTALKDVKSCDLVGKSQPVSQDAAIPEKKCKKRAEECEECKLRKVAEKKYLESCLKKTTPSNDRLRGNKSSIINMEEGKKATSAEKAISQKESIRFEEKRSSGSSKDAKNLSVQVMPPLNIRGGLTVQRTLNLFIKPTGSGTNNLTIKPNVGYEEVKLDSGGKERVQDLERCPEDCRNPDGGGCAAKIIKNVETEIQNLKSEVISVEKDVTGLRKNLNKMITPLPNVCSFLSDSDKNGTSGETSSRMTSADLRQNALYMFRSFQIVSNEIDKRIRNKQAQTEAPNKTPEVPEEKKESEGCKKKGEKKKTCAKCLLQKEAKAKARNEESDVGQTQKEARYNMARAPTKSPWDIGFCKTQATQVSASLLNFQNKPPETWSERFNLSKGSYTTAEVERAIAMVKEVSKSWEEVGSVRAGSSTAPAPHRSGSDSESVTTPPKEGTASKEKTAWETVSAASSDRDLPVKDQSDINMAEVMSVLTDTKERVAAEKGENKEASRGQRRSITYGDTSAAKPAPSRDSNVIEEKVSKISKDKTLCHIAQTMSSKSLRCSSSDSDSSDSSYSSGNVHGSIDSSRNAVKKEQPTGVKRPHPEEATAAAVFGGEMVVVKPPKNDAFIQTSLASSSETSSEDSGEADKDTIATIRYFIKGLTGTSQEELAKLTSTSSIPKTDLPTYSRTVLRTLQEQKVTKKSADNEDTTKSSKEFIVATTDYGNDANADDDLSSETKLHRLREFQKKASNGRDKRVNETTVLNVVEQRGDSGEGMATFTKRQLPFYRRVLGRIIEPHGKKTMGTSQSDAIPVDDSISEGEIRCRSSASIGEIHPFKYLNHDRKKLSKGALKYLKKHHENISKDFGDKTHRIARQRTQYNNWVMYHLQKNHNISLADESSSQER